MSFRISCKTVKYEVTNFVRNVENSIRGVSSSPSRFSHTHNTESPTAWPMTPKTAEHWQKAPRVS
jgi:hypothetical protein